MITTCGRLSRNLKARASTSFWTAFTRDAVVRLDDRLGDILNTGDLSYASSELLGEVLGASRVGYGLIDPEAETITVERSWNAPGLPSVAGVYQFSDYGTHLECQDLLRERQGHDRQALPAALFRRGRGSRPWSWWADGASSRGRW